MSLLAKKAKTVTLFHGTCADNAKALIANGWQPNQSYQGGNAGQTKFLYLTNQPENARWYANEKGCDVILEVTAPLDALAVDPEDGVADTVEEELANPNGLPGNVVLTQPLAANHFKFIAQGFDKESKLHHEASTQIDLPGGVAANVFEIGRKFIPDDVLAGDGRVEHLHVTVKYGVAEDEEKLRAAIAGVAPFTVTLARTTVFVASESSNGATPVVIEVHASQLEVLHKAIDAAMGTKPDDFPYVPHITIAYVKDIEAQHFAGAEVFAGVSFTAFAVTLSKHDDDNQVHIPLGKAMAQTASKPFAEWTQVEKNEDWAKRHKLPVVDGRVRLYHATPSATADTIAQTGLKAGSFLTDDKETALHQAGRDRGLKSGDLTVFEAWLPFGSFHGGTWAQTIDALPAEALNLSIVGQKTAAAPAVSPEIPEVAPEFRQSPDGPIYPKKQQAPEDDVVERDEDAVEDEPEEEEPEQEAQPQRELPQSPKGWRAPKKPVPETTNFKKWFGKSKVVDDIGQPLRVYHGTTHEIDEFDIDKAQSENYFGKGFYFSNDRNDVETNYATDKGGDLTSRVERRAEEIEQYLLDEGGVEDPDAVREEAYDTAKKELMGPNQGTTMPMYLSLQNPVVLKRKGGTYFELNYDEETGEESGSGMALYNAVMLVAGHWGVDGQKIWSEINEKIGDPEFTAFDFDQAARELDYIEDENGSPNAGSFVGDVFQEMGFDGIEMDAYAAFGPRKLGPYGGKSQGMPSIHEDTVHYIVWDPKKIKSAIGNRGKFDPKNPNITAAKRNPRGEPKPKATALPKQFTDDGFVTPNNKWIDCTDMDHDTVAARLGFRAKDPEPRMQAIAAGYVRVVVWLEQQEAFFMFKDAADAQRRAGDLLKRLPVTIENVGIEEGRGKYQSYELAEAEEKYSGGFMVTGATGVGDLGLAKKIMHEYLPMLGVKVPEPELKIVNQPRAGWLGRDTWQIWIKGGVLGSGDNTTIELQKFILNDEQTLRRVIAHELCHHADSLIEGKEEIAKYTNFGRIGYNTFRAGQRGTGHATTWKAYAQKFNAKYGADFVTERSDESYKQEEQALKPYHIRLYSHPSGNIYYAVSSRIGPKIRRYLDRRAENPDPSERQTTTDSRLFMNGATIGDGWSIPGEPNKAEKVKMLAELWDKAPEEKAVPRAQMDTEQVKRIEFMDMLKNWNPDKKKGSWEKTADYWDGLDQTAMSIISEYRQKAMENESYRQKWEVVPAPRLTKIWNDFAKTSMVRDEKGMDDIAWTVLHNIWKIHVNTILSGHTEQDPMSFVESVTGDNFEGQDIFSDYDNSYFDDDNGQWRITDYALDGLIAGAGKLEKASTAEQKLVAVDHILNIVHARSDLASWFVQGGTKTLNALAGKTAGKRDEAVTSMSIGTDHPDFPSPVLIRWEQGMRWREVLKIVKSIAGEIVGDRIPWRDIYIWKSLWDNRKAQDEGWESEKAKHTRVMFDVLHNGSFVSVGAPYGWDAKRDALVAPDHEASHKTPPLSDTQYNSPEMGEETNAYADIPERVRGQYDVPDLNTLLGQKWSSKLLKKASHLPTLERLLEDRGMSLGEAQGDWDKIEIEAAREAIANGQNWNKLSQAEKDVWLDKIGMEWLHGTWAQTEDKLNALKFPLTVYRGIKGDTLRDMYHGLEGEQDWHGAPKGFGVYWSYDERNAYVHEELAAGADSEGVGIIMFRGVIRMPGIIDWMATSWSNLVAPEEQEIDLHPGSLIEITGWKKRGETKWRKPTPKWRTVTAEYAEGQAMTQHTDHTPVGMTKSLKSDPFSEEIALLHGEIGEVSPNPELPTGKQEGHLPMAEGEDELAVNQGQAMKKGFKKDRRDNVPGQVYLLHFDIDPKATVDPSREDASNPFHARHYLGWAEDAQSRIRQHYEGQGARLTQALHEKGISFTVARVWDKQPDGKPATRNFERRLKSQGSLTRHCPICWRMGLIPKSRMRGKALENIEAVPDKYQVGPDYAEIQKDAAADEVRAVIAEINEKYPVNPENEKERIILSGGKPIVFFEVDDTHKGRLRIRTIRAVETKQGAGSLALRRITSIADKYGVAIELTASPYGDEGTRLDKDQLQSWYRKHQFEDEQGHDPALGYMIRNPKTAEASNIVSGEDVVTYVQKMNKWNREMAYQVVGLDAGGDYILTEWDLDKLEAGDDYDPSKAEQYAKKKTPIPPIVLNIDGEIRDGNHRVAAAKLRGDNTIDAYYPLDTYDPSETK